MHLQVLTPRGPILGYLQRRPAGTGPWHVRWADASVPGGKVWRSTHAILERDARAEARRLILAHCTGQPVAGCPTLAELIRANLDHRAPAPGHTRQNLACRLLAFARHVGAAWSPGTVTREEATRAVQSWLDARRTAGASPQTLRNDRLGVSGLCSFLLRRGLVSWPVNPAAGHLLLLPPVVKQARAPVSEADIAELLRAAKAVSPWLYGVLVLILSGLRPAGATRVRWADIQDGVVNVQEKRTVRRIRLSAWAAGELEQLPRAGERVWPFTHGNCFFAALRRVRWRAGLPDTVTAQALRRAAVQRLYRAGVSPQRAAQQLGHSVSTAERHYLHLQSLDSAAEVLDWTDLARKPVAKSVASRPARRRAVSSLSEGKQALRARSSTG